MADLVADWTPSQNQSKDKKQSDWIIYCDGAWGFAGAGAAAIITSPLRVKMRYATRLKIQCTNNIAEYEAILLGLRKARAMGIQRLIIKTDFTSCGWTYRERLQGKRSRASKILAIFKRIREIL